MGAHVPNIITARTHHREKLQAGGGLARRYDGLAVWSDDGYALRPSEPGANGASLTDPAQQQGKQVHVGAKRRCIDTSLVIESSQQADEPAGAVANPYAALAAAVCALVLLMVGTGFTLTSTVSLTAVRHTITCIIFCAKCAAGETQVTFRQEKHLPAGCELLLLQGTVRRSTVGPIRAIGAAPLHYGCHRLAKEVEASVNLRLCEQHRPQTFK